MPRKPESQPSQNARNLRRTATAFLLSCQIAAAWPASPLSTSLGATSGPWVQLLAAGDHKRIALHRNEARHVLTVALSAKGAARKPALLAAAAEAARLLSRDCVHAVRLRACIETGVGIEKTVKAVRSDLAFAPKVEADTPEGFPSYTPVGFIETKTYPKHRLVRTEMSGSRGAFFRLFNHIKKNDIAMTAPVPVERRADGVTTMAFLYGDPKAGPLVGKGDVQVVDVEPVTVVSIGLRGRDSDRARAQALKALEGWLARNAHTWERSGGWRTMGWNSPFVPSSRRYWEVQIPIRKRTSSASELDG